MSDLETVEIQSVGRLGDGIAAGPVHVVRALPSELISGVIKNGRIEDPRIIQPSDDRVAAPCRHFKACGGCVMQHASDAFVANWKLGLVRNALKRVDLDPDCLRGVSTSPQKSRRRAKYVSKKSKSGAIAGFRGSRSHTIVDVTECFVASEAVFTGVELARHLAREAGTRKSELEVSCTETVDGLDVSVMGGRTVDDELRAILPRIAQEHHCVRLHWNGELIMQQSQPVHVIAGVAVPLPVDTFLQATDHGESCLQDLVSDAVGEFKHALDLFSGCGTFALALSKTGAVTAIDGHSSMVDAMRAGANNAKGLQPIKTKCQNLFSDPLLKGELEKFDAIVLDPPRAGAASQVAEIAMSSVPNLAYVSCNPETFARDALVLVRGGYTLEWVHVVDQFRWSSHVELAAKFTKSYG